MEKKRVLTNIISIAILAIFSIVLWLGFTNIYSEETLDLSTLSYDKYTNTSTINFDNFKRIKNVSVTIDSITDDGEEIDSTSVDLITEGEIYDDTEVTLVEGENVLSLQFGQYFERKYYVSVQAPEGVTLSISNITINSGCNISNTTKGLIAIAIVVFWIIVSILSLVFSGKLKFDDISNWLNENVFLPINKNKDFKAALSFIWKCFLIYIIGIITIIRANFLYIDDIGRVYDGNLYDFETYSRFFGAKIINFINAYDRVFDNSPLSQSLSMLFMACAMAIIIWAIAPEKLKDKWMLIAAIPFALSPFFMQNMSLKIECIIHGASVLLATLPILLYKKRNWLYCLVTVICTMLMCETYTAATAVFPIVIVFLCAKEWNEGKENKEILKLLIESVLSYGIGLGLFYKFRMNPIDTHVSSEMPSLLEMPKSIIENLLDLYANVYYDFKTIWLLAIVVLFGLFIFAFVRNTKRDKSIAILVAFFTLFFMCIFCFGIYILLAQAEINPRSMYGFTMIASIIAVYMVDKGRWVCKVPMIAIAMFFIVFDLEYGNCLVLQQDYASVRIQAVLNYLNEYCIDSDKEYNFCISGDIGFAPELEKKFQSCAMLEILTPSMLGENWAWSQYKIYNYYDLPDNVICIWSNEYTGDNALPFYESTMWFDVYTDGTTIVIDVDK